MNPSVVEFLIQALRQKSLRPDPPVRDPATGAVMPQSQPTGAGMVDNAAGALRNRQAVIDAQSGYR